MPSDARICFTDNFTHFPHFSGRYDFNEPDPLNRSCQIRSRPGPNCLLPQLSKSKKRKDERRAPLSHRRCFVYFPRVLTARSCNLADHTRSMPSMEQLTSHACGSYSLCDLKNPFCHPPPRPHFPSSTFSQPVSMELASLGSRFLPPHWLLS